MRNDVHIRVLKKLETFLPQIFTFESFILVLVDLRANRSTYLITRSKFFREGGRSPAATAVESSHRVGESIDQALIDPGLSAHLYGFA